MPNRKRARQLPAASIGVLPWQQDFWLLLVEHALAKRSGPPDLPALEGFSAPAVTQYTATTPDLLRSFRKYNAGKLYHRQVRPFGFMVMLQQADDAAPSTVMRVIAPFNRNPAKAAGKAFDRDSGAVVRSAQLKTYATSLKSYHNHPEAKFLNGERGDRGPTQRRHVIVKSILHIGKEANKLEPQSVMGVDPKAQVEFCAVSESRAERLKAVCTALHNFGSCRMARETGLTRQYLSKVASGGVAVTEVTLSKIEQAMAVLEVGEARIRVEDEAVLAWLQAKCDRSNLRNVAAEIGVNAGQLSRILTRKRSLSSAMRRFFALDMTRAR